MDDMYDKTLIITLFRDLAIAWNHGDGDLYASYFTEDCDYVTFHGHHLKGRRQIAHAHNELFDGLLKNSQLVGEIKTLRYLAKDMILVHQTGGVKLSFQKQVPTSRRSINSNVVVQEGDDWRIAAFHNCRIHGEGLLPRIVKWFI